MMAIELRTVSGNSETDLFWAITIEFPPTKFIQSNHANYNKTLILAMANHNAEKLLPILLGNTIKLRIVLFGRIK